VDNEWTSTLHRDHEQGYTIAHGTCPECGELIVYLAQGTYYADDDGSWLTDVRSKELIYPRSPAREPLPDEVTGEYRRDFQEAVGVLGVSPKASAAISRRLLQHTLEEQFEIAGSSLAKQIEQFVVRPEVPSHLTDAVDTVRIITDHRQHRRAPAKGQRNWHRRRRRARGGRMALGNLGSPF
jgi:hypothetical protein